MLKVLKLGGTSVGSGALIKSAAASIAKVASDAKVVVVVSAMAGISDQLVQAANSGFNSENEIDAFIQSLTDRHLGACAVAVEKSEENVRKIILDILAKLTRKLKEVHSIEPGAREKCWIMACGEKLSAPILSGAISDHIPSSFYYGDDRLIITDDSVVNVIPNQADSETELRLRLLPALESGVIPVLTGFIGCTADGVTTTLGRGSSDYIASILGSALDADEIQIWTDVDGMLTADPNLVDNSRLIDRISFTEAGELAYFGAKVLHPKTLLPAVIKNIPVRIINSRNPESRGTLIVSAVESSSGKPTAITAMQEIILVDLHSTDMLDAHGFLAMIFNVFRQFHVSVDMVSTTEVSVSITVNKIYENNLEPVVEELSKVASVRVMKDKALICVIGEGMKSSPGLTGAIFSCLGNYGINVNCISQGALEMNLSFVIDNKDAVKAVRLLHEELFSG